MILPYSARMRENADQKKIPNTDAFHAVLFSEQLQKFHGGIFFKNNAILLD